VYDDMPPWPDADAPNESLTDLIQREINADHSVENGTQIVTGWALVAEVATPDGARGLQMLTSEGATDWDALGWLRYHVLEIERGVLVSDDD
jgi:hypothetical protein